METYTQEYYSTLEAGTRRSAKVISPLVLEYVQPRSIIDVGCGRGIWLSVFKELGVQEITGIDRYVDSADLEIPKDRFVSFDLTHRLELERRFDLVICLEVAEHLPAERADDFVGDLVGLGSLILFSAAIPSQGGKGHVNEQWPDYWVEHFSRRDFVAVDCLRSQIWENQDVEWWYAQNMLFFVHRDELPRYPLLERQHEITGGAVPPLVHPAKYLALVHWIHSEFSK